MALTKIHGSRQIQVETIENEQIKDNVLTNAKIKTDANISISKLNTTTANFDANGILRSGVVLTTNIADNSITTDKIVNLNVTASKLAVNSVETSKIVDASVIASKIAIDAITTDKIVNGAVTEPKIATGAVTTDRIADGAVTTDKLADTYVNVNGAVPMAANLNLNGNQIINIGTPTVANNAATKAYVDGLITGISWQQPVISILTALPVAPLEGDRHINNIVGDPNRNRIITFTSGAWVAVVPIDNASVFVRSDDTAWTFDAQSVADFKWLQFAGAGQINDGNGLYRMGNVLNVGQGNGITVSTDAVAVSLSAISGLEFALGQLQLSDSIKGSALAIANKVLSVKVDNSTIEIVSDQLSIRDAGVTTAKIADLSVGTTKLANLAVTTAKIADATVTAPKLDVAAIDVAGRLGGFTSAHVSDLNGSAITNVNAVTLNSLNEASFLRTNANSQVNVGSTLNIAGTLNVLGTFQLNSGTVTAQASELNALGTFVNNFIPTEPINGTQLTYSLGAIVKDGSVKVYLNGLRQLEGASNDYTLSIIAGATTITFITAPMAGSTLIVDFRF